MPETLRNRQPWLSDAHQAMRKETRLTHVPGQRHQQILMTGCRELNLADRVQTETRSTVGNDLGGNTFVFFPHLERVGVG